MVKKKTTISLIPSSREVSLSRSNRKAHKPTIQEVSIKLRHPRKSYPRLPPIEMKGISHLEIHLEKDNCIFQSIDFFLHMCYY